LETGKKEGRKCQIPALGQIGTRGYLNNGEKGKKARRQEAISEKFKSSDLLLAALDTNQEKSRQVGGESGEP